MASWCRNPSCAAGSPNVALNTPHVYEMKTDNRGWASFLNALAQGSSGTKTLTPYGPPRIGRSRVYGPNYYYYCRDRAERIFYSRPLSLSERAALIGHLNGRDRLATK